MKYGILILTAILLLMASCSMDKGTPGQYGYISLAGSMANREAYIDGVQVGVDPADDTNSFRLKGGVHKLEIRSKNRVLLAEDIDVIAGETVSITVP
jgi:hypothetical protein